MEDIPSNISNLKLYDLTLILIKAVTDTLRVKGGISLSARPEVKEKKIVQFGRRMRVDGLEKFGERTVFSAIYFYRDKSHMEKHNAVGSLVFYVPVSYISKLLHLLDYPRIDEDDEPAVLDACGTIANLFGGAFVKEMSGRGYIFLEMSPFESYVNTAVDGLEFSADQKCKYEMSMEIKGEKRLVLELTMAPIPNY